LRCRCSGSARVRRASRGRARRRRGSHSAARAPERDPELEYAVGEYGRRRARQARRERGAEREPPYRPEHGHHRELGRAEHERELAGPRRLVEQGGEAGEEEAGEQEREVMGSSGRSLPSGLRSPSARCPPMVFARLRSLPTRCLRSPSARCPPDGLRSPSARCPPMVFARLRLAAHPMVFARLRLAAHRWSSLAFGSLRETCGPTFVGLLATALTLAVDSCGALRTPVLIASIAVSAFAASAGCAVAAPARTRRVRGTADPARRAPPAFPRASAATRDPVRSRSSQRTW